MGQDPGADRGPMCTTQRLESLRRRQHLGVLPSVRCLSMIRGRWANVSAVSSLTRRCRHSLADVHRRVVLPLVEQLPPVPQGSLTGWDGTFGMDDRASLGMPPRSCEPTRWPGEVFDPDSADGWRRSRANRYLRRRTARRWRPVDRHRKSRSVGLRRIPPWPRTRCRWTTGKFHAPHAAMLIAARASMSAATESSHVDVRSAIGGGRSVLRHILKVPRPVRRESPCGDPTGQFSRAGDGCHLDPEVPLIVGLVEGTDGIEIGRPSRMPYTQGDDAVDIPSVGRAQCHQRQRARTDRPRHRGDCPEEPRRRRRMSPTRRARAPPSFGQAQTASCPPVPPLCRHFASYLPWPTVFRPLPGVRRVGGNIGPSTLDLKSGPASNVPGVRAPWRELVVTPISAPGGPPVAPLRRSHRG